MNSPMTHLVTHNQMGLYEPLHQYTTPWPDSFKTSQPLTAHESKEKLRYDDYDEDEEEQADEPANKNKKVRRLAQNRDAARKSRLRKKAYVQHLESSRSKLVQLEQELDNTTRHHSLQDSAFGFSKSINPGIAGFEIEYSHWVEEQHRKVCELRTALQQSHTNNENDNIELRILVDINLSHYHDLFRMKEDAAKSDIFYLLSGAWKSCAERFFLWIGGSRPSDLLNVVIPQMEALSEQQVVDVCNLQQSSRQAEDALSQGMDKLQQIISEEVTNHFAGSYGDNYQVAAAAMEKLETLQDFVNQADHLRQQTLQQMSRILTTRQAARALVALGEYLHRLRALSSLWTTRPSS